MAKRGAHKATKKGATKKPIESYDHQDKKRANNPPVGLVTPQTDPERGAKKTYQYDPHLDPQLVWAGKAEHTSFEVPTVSLQVHERIDQRILAVRLRRGVTLRELSDSVGLTTLKGREPLTCRVVSPADPVAYGSHVRERQPKRKAPASAR